MLRDGATSFAKLRQKFRKVQKSAEKFVQIAARFEENSTALVLGQECRCASILIFSARLYIALTTSVKFRIDSPKRLGMNKFVRTESHPRGKLSKTSLGCYARERL